MKQILMFIAASLGIFSSCSDDNAFSPELRTSQPSVTFSASGKTEEIKVYANGKWSYEVTYTNTDAQEWLTVTESRSESTFDGALAVKADPNPDTGRRSASLVLTLGDNVKIISVVQEGESQLPVAREIIGSWLVPTGTAGIGGVTFTFNSNLSCIAEGGIFADTNKYPDGHFTTTYTVDRNIINITGAVSIVITAIDGDSLTGEVMGRTIVLSKVE